MEYAVKAITGCVLAGCPVIALLFLGMLFAGILLDEHNKTLHPKSPAMRLSQPRMEFMSKQMDLALDKKLYTFDDVEKFIIKTGAELEELKTLKIPVAMITKCMGKYTDRKAMETYVQKACEHYAKYLKKMRDRDAR